MDKRLYFIAGDLLSNIICGAVVGWVVSLFITPEWNMFLAMFIAMAVGMVLSLPLYLPAAYFFGAMEVMVPVMFTGMMSAMVIGMWAAMQPLGSGVAFLGGAAIGLACIAAIWLLNSMCRGIQ